MKPSERPPHDKKPTAKDGDEQELSIEDVERVSGGGAAIGDGVGTTPSNIVERQKG